MMGPSVSRTPPAAAAPSVARAPPAATKRPPSTHAHACVSPFTTVPTVSALSTLGSYGRGSARGNYRPPMNMQMVFMTHAMKTPSTASQAQVDAMKSRQPQHQELIEIDDESNRPWLPLISTPRL